MRASRSRTARALAHRRALGADAARDLHPGNVRFIALGRLVLLDLGLVGRLDDADRLAFAGLLYTLSTGDGVSVARIFWESAAGLPCLRARDRRVRGQHPRP